MGGHTHRVHEGIVDQTLNRETRDLSEDGEIAGVMLADAASHGVVLVPREHRVCLRVQGGTVIHTTAEVKRQMPHK